LEQNLVADAREALNEIFPKLAAYIEREHPNEYPTSVSKNREKCIAMVVSLCFPPEVSSEPKQEKQWSLF